MLSLRFLQVFIDCAQVIAKLRRMDLSTGAHFIDNLVIRHFLLQGKAYSMHISPSLGFWVNCLSHWPRAYWRNMHELSCIPALESVLILAEFALSLTLCQCYRKSSFGRGDRRVNHRHQKPGCAYRRHGGARPEHAGKRGVGHTKGLIDRA